MCAASESTKWTVVRLRSFRGEMVADRNAGGVLSAGVAPPSLADVVAPPPLPAPPVPNRVIDRLQVVFRKLLTTNSGGFDGLDGGDPIGATW